MIGKAREHMKTQQLHQVLNGVWSVVADANRYFASEEPWAKAKTDPKRQGTILYVTAEVIRQIAILAQPFVPDLGGQDARSIGRAGRRARLRASGDAASSRASLCRRPSRFSRAMWSPRTRA